MKPRSKLLKTEIYIKSGTLFSCAEEGETKQIIGDILLTVQEQLDKISKENRIHAKMLKLNFPWAEDWQGENLTEKFITAVILKALAIAIEESLTNGGELKQLIPQAIKKVNLDEILCKLSIEFGEESLKLSQAGKLGILNSMQIGNK